MSSSFTWGLLLHTHNPSYFPCGRRIWSKVVLGVRDMRGGERGWQVGKKSKLQGTYELAGRAHTWGMVASSGMGLTQPLSYALQKLPHCPYMETEYAKLSVWHSGWRHSNEIGLSALGPLIITQPVRNSKLILFSS